MKHLSKVLFATLFVLGFSVAQAQDENNPWAIGVGVNAVDYFSAGEDQGPLGSYFQEFFNVEDHWNILPSISRISVGRYIGNGFSATAVGTINQIDRIGDVEVGDLAYYGIDGMLSYSLRNVLNGPGGWADPYVGIGGGYTWLEESNNAALPDNFSNDDGDLGTVGVGTGNVTAGLNFWISENLAINAASTYKHVFEDAYGAQHFQHSLGVVFTFGGKDTDGDGIYDDQDECPETPGLAEFNGCPDTDSDGIEDRKDDCPNVAGTAEFNGCPDTDGDGIPDPKDDCPTVAGIQALNGCPDADGDGIKDSEDNCPNEAGPASNNGCPFEDKDGDGVLDKDDQCPDVAGTVANNGCPEVTVEVMNELNEYSRTILFDLNKSTIRSESFETLQNIADIMSEYPTAKFHIEGHTDSQGSEAYNEKLSRERAASVRTYLTTKGVAANKLTSEGYGELRPIATNKTAAGRQQNRRVEIKLEKDRK
ncbi:MULTISPECIES: OmpA family protein [Croceibacter]|mgnify:FL=1|jgi:outer membrane protein OmpA-like peptidoglycan-associated protein/opacity protein-like surface antigen|uniref:Thrombospondin type 3 repeat:OmpA/MotB n=1 Tax=Croceibacter atlanticus (strain ATCC BAA-628 / JCM 21780 / CIP 108009 / IAM 15332 / KCTC 12090 / HTCC2559) TaxID=216432 RepID=A3U661_CROAH|nr:MULTISPECIES: OmpA family protein [Croceibacter]HAT70488.1 cell envelope biogenesis protein OmpA [Flavobacteriaceae bacterium]EAP87728.1 Thrombospondin type 3 repeat:OmpA/MotB [Croceibacter atlanticus HTCC2559]MAM23174.1 cell envelope biogenesis protein OmpA [Croceibacter sp.]MBG25251.1 cell envelope biogenesis protein OmpA [Croceibacter sp.]MBW4970041.1 OmpA family protein [Croceibacter atlanticus]|tara:strand:- start:1582 stop:3018 length:1437 start_codon:yes stop_codon:yes gene_type:complete